MSRGRCPGCGYENASCKAVRDHTMRCSEFQTLYREEPEKALDPEDEYVRYREWLKSDEGRAALEDKQAERSVVYRNNAEDILERQQKRWKGG